MTTVVLTHNQRTLAIAFHLSTSLYLYLSLVMSDSTPKRKLSFSEAEPVAAKKTDRSGFYKLVVSDNTNQDSVWVTVVDADRITPDELQALKDSSESCKAYKDDRRRAKGKEAKIEVDAAYKRDSGVIHKLLVRATGTGTYLKDAVQLELEDPTEDVVSTTDSMFALGVEAALRFGPQLNEVHVYMATHWIDVATANEKEEGEC